MGNHALVYGATGIQGWAVTNQLLNNYPTAGSFDKITALTNRPVTEEMLWPSSSPSSPAFQVISGIDLLDSGGQDAVNESLQSKVSDIETVTHVFFFAYIYKSNPDEEIQINVELLKRAVVAAETLSQHLEFVLLPTGSKAYGVQCLAEFPFADKLPLSEDLPRIPEPWQSQNFYYNQVDWLAERSSGKAWTFCEIRPDFVVGFVPNNNTYCLAQTLATYLSCYRAVEGEGATCAFPGTEQSWRILFNEAGQDVVARFAIHAALHPETCGDGRAFNVASQSQASSWEAKWPIICEFFGLKGTPPPANGSGPQPGQYLVEHLDEWQKLEKQHGLATGRVGNDRSLATYQYFIMTMFDFDRPLDLTKMHQAWSQGGQAEEQSAREMWWTAFQRFRDAKIIS